MGLGFGHEFDLDVCFRDVCWSRWSSDADADADLLSLFLVGTLSGMRFNHFGTQVIEVLSGKVKLQA